MNYKNRLSLSPEIQNRITDTFLSSPAIYDLIRILKRLDKAGGKYPHSIAVLNNIPAEELEQVKMRGYKAFTRKTRQRLVEAREKDRRENL